MNEVKITYETLFDLLRREKSKEELQELDPTFYADVISYLQGKFSLLKGSESQSGLFGASESEKVKIQVVNIKKMIKELYERRLTKILRLAFNRSKTGAGLMNTTSMLPEEKEFFEQSLHLFTKDRVKVLNRILELDVNSKGVPDKPPAAQHREKADAAEEDSRQQPQPDQPAKEENTSEEQRSGQDSAEEDKKEESKDKEEYVHNKDSDTGEKKVKIRFKEPIPKFVDRKMESYGPFQEGDVSEVPEMIANILLKKDKAERL